MLTRRSASVPMVVVCAANVMAAAATRAADTPSRATPAKAWAGACTYCHDEGVAPPLFGRGLAPAAIAAVVRGGLNGMPAFHPSEITDAELQALAVWVAQQPAPVKR